MNGQLTTGLGGNSLSLRDGAGALFRRKGLVAFIFAAVVLGTAVESTGDFRRPFSRDVCAIIQDAPCPVLIATGPRQSRARAVA